MAFRERCAEFLLSGLAARSSSGQEVYARMVISGVPGPCLVRSDEWDLSCLNAPLPSDTCAIVALSQSEMLVAACEFDLASIERVPVNPPMLPRIPHRMGLNEFCSEADAVVLGHGHGRRWEVFLDGESLGFADDVHERAAMVSVHGRAVNNALYVASTGSMVDGAVLPSAQAVEDHAALLCGRGFGLGIELANASWTPRMALAARDEGWEILSSNGCPVSLVSIEGAGFPTEDDLRVAVRSGAKPHHFLARTILADKAPMEYCRMLQARPSHPRELMVQRA